MIDLIAEATGVADAVENAKVSLNLLFCFELLNKRKPG